MNNNKLVFQPTECLNEDEVRLYLESGLNESDRYRVENHLLDCPFCSDAVEGFASEYNFLNDKQLNELKKGIDKEIAKHSNHSKPTIFSLNRIAAAIIFLIISAAAIFYWNTQKIENAIFAEIQSSNSIMENTRGVDDFVDGSLYVEGIELYRNEDYSQSLFFFENILETQPENPTAHYFSGVSALNLGEYEKAIENLTFARLNEEKYYEEATWNLILANMGVGNTGEAKALIDDILKIEGGYYSASAEKLKKELEEK